MYWGINKDQIRIFFSFVITAAHWKYYPIKLSLFIYSVLKRIFLYESFNYFSNSIVITAVLCKQHPIKFSLFIYSIITAIIYISVLLFLWQHSYNSSPLKIVSDQIIFFTCSILNIIFVYERFYYFSNSIVIIAVLCK